MKKYIINNIEYSQDELTIEQDQLIAELIAQLDIGDVQDIANLKLSQIINALAKHKALQKFINIILRDKEGKPITLDAAGAIKNSQLQTIIKDFFFLNPKVKELLINLKNLLATTSLTSGLSNTEKKPSKNFQK